MTNERLEELKEKLENLRFTRDANDYCDLLALTAYQQPTSDAVQGAIEWLEGEKLAYEIEAIDAEIIAERNESDPDEIREIYNRLARLAETAITALRQMQPEPCYFCDPEEMSKPKRMTEDKFFLSKSHHRGYVLYSVQDGGSLCDSKIISFCPNCGRRLGVE